MIVYDLTMHVESIQSSVVDLSFAVGALVCAPTVLLLFLPSLRSLGELQQWELCYLG